MNVEELAGRIVVRYREAGHLRLDVPPELCRPAAAAAIDSGLRELAGVYRVAFDPRGRKLSIRFDAHACGTGDVARRLFGLLAHLPKEPSAAVVALHDAGERVRAVVRRGTNRVRTALARLGVPAAPEGSLQAKLRPVIASALTEKAITNFINDIVAFYLIKVHWELISQRWLKDPLKFRNAWLTTFWLVFLLVRYRKQGPKA
ncbi:MAG: hypothetical protein OHM77_08830 [Candidatus Nitricoxidivorans perseverans]|uniref:Uncharacterized protein n=1 Tax=Candidatus Nitricoxidivorans perseverans TaxID=2975601 RepID=A0AA49FJH7_9PROT|nr:MAG: hypothetical protein OHM77_08830 [Candidatus Nitricoxidivorans perseverans]